MKTVTLILAAGRGERMGGPKALLAFEGKPLAAVHAARALGETIVVTRADVAAALGAWAVNASEDALSVVVSGEDDALGPAGSIAAAVRGGALDEADAVVITPVDVRPASHADVKRLLRALEGHDAARFERGHPVVVRGDVLRREYGGAAPILRDLLARTRVARLAGVPEGPHGDLDRPEDVLAATGAPPSFFPTSLGVGETAVRR